LDAKDKGLKQRLLGDDRNPDQVKAGRHRRIEERRDRRLLHVPDPGSGRRLPFLELPKRINLSDPAQNKSYARATFTNKAGKNLQPPAAVIGLQHRPGRGRRARGAGPAQSSSSCSRPRGRS